MISLKKSLIKKQVAVVFCKRAPPVAAHVLTAERDSE